MWILPNNLITYRFARDTKGLVKDLEEFSQLAEKSLMWRSKHSHKRTWSQRWKREKYIQRLSTRILRPSHIKSFLERYISSLPDFHANLSQMQVERTPQMIRDIYTHTSQEESQNPDQLTLYSKTSKESSQAKQVRENRYSSMSSETWKKEVIRQRGLWSQRMKLGLHTNGRESLSWPTPNQRDHMGKRRKLTNGENISNTTGTKFGMDLNQAIEHWPTPDATNISDGVPWEVTKKQMMERRKRTKEAMKEGKVKAGSGRSPNLAMKVQREIYKNNWATPNTMDYLPPKEGKAMQRIYETHRKGRTAPSNLREQVNPNSWPTPTVAEAGKISNKPNYGQKGLSNHPSIVGETIREKGKKDRKGEKSWPTPQTSDKNAAADPTRKEHRTQLRDVETNHLPNGRHDLAQDNTDGKSQGSLVQKKMKLNPNWVEQLMGLPVGWTQLPTEWTD